MHRRIISLFISLSLIVSMIMGYVPVQKVYGADTTVNFSKTDINLTVDETTTLTATVDSSVIDDKAVIFTSNDADVVTVTDAVYNSDTGISTTAITAVGAGTTTITALASDDTTFSTCTVTVEEVAPRQLAVFMDDFEDGNADGWTTYGSGNENNRGNWSVNSVNQYTINGCTGAKSVALDTNFADLVYEADLKVNGINDDNTGVLFRVTDPINNEFDGYSGYYAGLRRDKKVMLGRVTEGAWKELTSVDYPWTSGHMKIVAVGNHIQVFVNDMDTPKIDYIDNDGKQITTAGAVGLRTWWGTSVIDNIYVREYSDVVTSAPKFSVSGGIYSTEQTVELTSDTVDTVIRYTTDGTMPNESSPIYSTPLTISSDTIIKAYAQKDGEMASDISTVQYIISNATDEFAENFEDGNADGWTTYTGLKEGSWIGSWSVENGEYTVQNPRGDKSVTEATYDNFVIEADINISASEQSSGLIFRVSEPGDGCDNMSGYFVGINTHNFIEVGKMNSSGNNGNGSWTPMKEIPTSIQPNQTYNLKIIGIDSNFWIYLDGGLVSSFLDFEYNNGAIGVRAWNDTGTVSFDNIKAVRLVKDGSEEPIEELFTDSFETNTSLDNWTRYQGTWGVSSGVLNVNSGTGYKAIANDTNFSDLLYEGDITITGNTGDAGVLFRVLGASNGPDNVVGYYAGINEGANAVVLGKMNNNWTELARSPKEITQGQTYHIKVLAFGSSIKIFVDDMETPIIHYIDNSYTKGAIGVRVYNTDTSFDNISVSPYLGEAVVDTVPRVSVTTKSGIAPVLPTEVKALYTDGSNGTVNVTWNEINPEQYQTLGTFVVKGQVEGTEVLAEAVVTVAPEALARGEGEVVPNKDTLVNTPFIPLPLGSIEADGWLLEQLELQKSGATGLAEELYNELGSNSAWLGGNAPNSDWERPAYYVKGLIALAYTLGDEELISKSSKWIEWTLNSQKENGFFGPEDDDWWPRMPMLYALRDYYEATGDSRVLMFMMNYFRYQLQELPNRPLRDWGKIRVGDNIDSVLWLYNRINNSEDEATLIKLAYLLADQGYDETDILTNNDFYGYGDDFYPNHAVNVAEAIKMPAIYYQLSKDETDKNAFRIGDNYLLQYHGQITGMPSGTEFLAGPGSTQGVELCAIVERMQSNEEAQMILGDPHIGDQLEKITFNSLPGSMSKDIREHQYYALPNQVQSINGGRGHRQDYATGTMPSIDSGYPCCRFNMHMGWPYYVKNMWAATNDGGIAAMAYGPSKVTTKVNDILTTVTEQTNYPFEEQLGFTINTSQDNEFPLKLRIPEWCQNPVVKVNGQEQEGVTAGEYYTINRTWKDGDIITLDLPMEVEVSTQVSNSVGIERGPLVYSLKVGEQWNLIEGSDRVAGFGEYEVLPTTPWNYGLIIDRNNPDNSIAVNKGEMPANPFIQETTPVALTIDARKIPTWGLGPNGMDADEVPVGPVASSQPIEEVTLVPFGAENLRVTYLPQMADASSPGSKKYEAEDAILNHVQVRDGATNYSVSVSNGKYVGGIDYSDSYVEFDNVYASEAGEYTLEIAYASGSAGYSTHTLTVNGGAPQTVKYSPVDGWGKFTRIHETVSLDKGNNTIRLTKGNNFAELDYISVFNGEDSPQIIVKEILVSSKSDVDAITEAGGTLQMAAEVLPQEAENKEVTWSVENVTGNGTIDENGLLRAVADGKVIVKATSVSNPDISGICEITISGQREEPEEPQNEVTEVKVSGINEATTITTKGGTLQMVAEVLPKDAEDKSVTWSIANGADYANISPSGVLTAKGDGRVTVKATSVSNPDISGTCEITISGQREEPEGPQNEVTEVKVSGSNEATTITTKGGTLQMVAAVLPESAEDKSVTWSIVNGADYATISPLGVLAAKGNGKVTVKATSVSNPDISGICEVTISGQRTSGNSDDNDDSDSGNSGSNGGSTSINKTEEAKVEGNQITLPKAKADSKGVATIEVMTQSLESAINNSKNQELTIKASIEGEAKEVKASLPVKQLDIAKQKDIQTVDLDLGLANLSFEPKLFTQDIEGAKKLEVSVAKVDTDELAQEVKSIVGNVPVYDFNASVDGNKVSKFGEGDVTISLDYNLENIEDSHKVVVYYIGDDGTLEVVKNAKYNPETGKVEFSINHFSKYAVINNNVNFNDIQGLDWVKESIEALAAREIIDGVGNNNFSPKDKVTRAQFIKMLMNALDLVDENAKSTFKDVSEGTWYYSAVASAEELGIVNGKSDGNYGINDRITRQEMAAMAYRASKAAGVELKEVVSGIDFADKSDIASYALESIGAMQKAGVISGMGESKFAPKENATRAQAAKIIYSLFNLQ